MRLLILATTCSSLLAVVNGISRESASSHLDVRGPSHPLLQPRNFSQSDCIYGVYDSSCWAVLDLSHWLSDWYSTTRACPAGELHTTQGKCIGEGETWTDAFLRFAQNITGGPSCVPLYACQGDSPNTNEIRRDLDDLEAARYRYICYNIYAINFFFSDWYTAMHDAALEAGDTIGEIVQAIDPPTEKSNVFLNDLLSALTAGLAFLAIPEAAALGGAAATIAPIFLKSIQQAPGVAKIIWPIGSVQRETIEIATLQNQLNTVVRALEPRISDALAIVMGRDQTDILAFLAFAERGEFSGLRGHLPNIANDTSGLLIGFTTFLVSEALVLDGWHVVASLDTNPLGLTNGTIECPYWTRYNFSGHNGWNREFAPCEKFPNFNAYDMECYAYDQYGQCNNSYWWYSGYSGVGYYLGNTAYTLAKDPYYGYFHSASKAEEDPTSILQMILANKWSTGPLLLRDAGICVFTAAIYEAIIDKSLFRTLADYKSYFRTGSTYPHDPRDNYYLLSFLKEGNLTFNAPNGTNYEIGHDGITDFSCTSQLNVTVYTDWPSVWYLHKKFT